MDYEIGDGTNADDLVTAYVIEKRNAWRDDYTSNYQSDHDEYDRLWRAKWSPEDRQRKTERSQIITPGLQQAVESSVAEVEEATFGRGKFFDMDDDIRDPNPKDIESVKNALMEDFESSMIRRDVSEILLNAAVTGTGIGEVVLEECDELRPSTREIMDGALRAYGVEKKTRVRVKLRPVRPSNFLIEPSATCIDDAVGVIIDEFVPRHQVEELQDRGIYKQCDLGEPAADTEIEKDKELSVTFNDRVRLTKYYGKVPKEYLDDEGDESTSRYVEAVVIIANDGVLLKAMRNPYMMQDRPVVAFQWDIVPGRFWGRGICEKGFMSQKALDTEVRARIDALGLVVHPMMAIDATRMPRGFRPKIQPGRTILTQGPPREVLEPIKFGSLDTNTFPQAQALQSMLQQATGAVDSTGLLSSVSGETKAGAVSMSLGAVIKRHKRTLINFQDSCLIPFIRKATWRYMQFDPENYPVKDYKFRITSTLGIIAREYEVSQLISLLQTMSHESPLYPALIKSIVDNMNLSNREQLIETLEKAAQPTKEQVEAQQQAEKRAEEQHQAQLGVFTSQANESNARANKYKVEAELEPQKVKNELIRSITQGMDDNDGDAEEFNRRLQLFDREIKVEELNMKKRDYNFRVKQAQAQQASNQALVDKLSG